MGDTVEHKLVITWRSPFVGLALGTDSFTRRRLEDLAKVMVYRYVDKDARDVSITLDEPAPPAVAAPEALALSRLEQARIVFQQSIADPKSSVTAKEQATRAFEQALAVFWQSQFECARTET